MYAQTRTSATPESRLPPRDWPEARQAARGCWSSSCCRPGLWMFKRHVFVSSGRPSSAQKGRAVPERARAGSGPGAASLRQRGPALWVDGRVLSLPSQAAAVGGAGPRPPRHRHGPGSLRERQPRPGLAPASARGSESRNLRFRARGSDVIHAGTARRSVTASPSLRFRRWLSSQ